MGCYIQPRECFHALDTCDYILLWHVEDTDIRFELTAKMYSYRLLWAAVGLNHEQQMVNVDNLGLFIFIFCLL